MLCKRCAAPIEDGAEVCIHCGATQKYVDNPAVADEENITKPKMSIGDYLLTFLVGGIPVIGIIFLVIWSCVPEKKEGRKKLSLAYLIWLIIAFIIFACIFIYLCYAAMKSSGMEV